MCAKAVTSGDERGGEGESSSIRELADTTFPARSASRMRARSRVPLTRVQVAMLGPLEVVTVHLPPRRGRCTQSFAYWLGVMPGAALNVRVKWA